VPEGAKYLNTVTQTKEKQSSYSSSGQGMAHDKWVDCWLVWHYYEVEVDNPQARQ